MRRSVLLAGLLVVILASTAQSSVAGPPEPDDRVTPASAYVRHDGGTDQAIRHCSDTSTSTVPDADPNDGGTDSNDGGAFRQGNEPSVAIDPTNPDLVFASWNYYCDTDLGGGWQGLAFSTDRGESWTVSKIPGAEAVAAISLPAMAPADDRGAYLAHSPIAQAQLESTCSGGHLDAGTSCPGVESTCRERVRPTRWSSAVRSGWSAPVAS
jgi:hypothetical protein